LTALYADRTKGRHWPDRYPRFANLSFNTKSPEGKVAQSSSIAAFLVLPAILQIFFIAKFLEGTPYRRTAKLPSGFAHLTHFVSLRDAFSGAYTYDRVGDIAPSFAPFWEPWLFVIIEIVVMAIVARSFLAIFRSPHAA